MPTNYSGRITTILVILAASLFFIFPNFNFRDHNLTPGIDMAGGTSLLYEIKPPEGVPMQGNLAEQVMVALKKRVDPNGVRNLIWRPQGNTRLEIQMPFTGAKPNDEARKAYFDAQRALEATNIRPSRVVSIIESTDLTTDQKQEELNRISAGSKKREELIGALRSLWSQIQDASNAGDFKKQAELEKQYTQMQDQLADTNLSVAELDRVLEMAPEERDSRLAEIRARNADFPARLEAIEQLVATHDEYARHKDTLDDAADLKRLLRGSGVLQFHILVTDLGSPDAQAMIRRLQERGPAPQAGDTMRWFAVDKPEHFEHQTFTYGDQQWVLVYTTPDRSMANRPGQSRWALETATEDRDQNTGHRIVRFRFNVQGARYFAELTGTNVHQPLAIVLDERVISAPNINQQIGREGVITGGGKTGFGADELEYLVSTLRAGSLPAQLADEPISERTVGPSIGADNLKRGFWSCVFGLAVVAVFLIGYYYIAGVVAMVAVILNMILILGGMAAINATFTLPGVAGIILTIGMAVDANVLIFERLREEQIKGLSIRMALRNAYDKAFSAILDSNVTTGITSLILYYLGTEEVKGFGITLLLGMVSSLFTALFVTKTIFGIMIDKFGLERLSSLPLTFPKWDQMLRPNIDWMKKAWFFGAFSMIFIVVGCGAFAWKWGQGQILDIEFASGTAVQFDLENPMPQDEVRKLFDDADPDKLPSPTIVAVGDSGKTYEIVTPNADAVQVKDAVQAELAGLVKAKLKSNFDSASADYQTARATGTIVPITSATQQLGGFVPQNLTKHRGGVAIVLTNLDPPLTAQDIAERIDSQRLQPRPGQSAPVYREIDVETDTGVQPARNAVVLVSDPNFPFEKDPVRWDAELALPMWGIVTEAVSNPPVFNKVNNFDAQVAGEAQRDAVVAMVLSVIAIMAYIWVRFGNLRYGTATVIALLHDTLFTIGAVGVAHYVANTAVGDALLIEPFRLNLTLLAAILTVMGYSMNDTVVVFDRIRENRGKFGHLSPTIINDSINQTLSRTLLTGGTTIVTIFVMYIWGGQGIHGFTFTLLVGILVGTYSSIAIAAPILLIGAQQPQDANKRSSVASGQLAASRGS
jgi:SecD/SecF fusion protein